MPKATDKAKGAVKGAVKAANQAVRGRVGIYATLSKEHGEVASLMSELADTEADDADRRRDLFSEVKTELLAHAKAEDAVFYSALDDEAREKIGHARKEHEEVETLLDELSEMQIDHQSWMNKFLKLKDSVEHHVHEEENEMFPLAQKVLSADDAKSLDETYQARRSQEKRRHRSSAA